MTCPAIWWLALIGRGLTGTEQANPKMTSLGGAEPPFTAKPEVVQFAGLLFDMDGTIVDSTDALVKHWYK